ncbi:MAG: hypothetical protein Q9183_004130 [Haloplaca sp. 2 TL-2023]
MRTSKPSLPSTARDRGRPRHTTQYPSCDKQHAAHSIPWLVNAILGHQRAVDDDSRAEKKDEWQKPYRCFQSRIAARELEVYRDTVERDVSPCIGRASEQEEQHGILVEQKVHREDATRWSGEYGKFLLQSKDDEERPSDNEERYDRSAIPRVERSPKVYRHDRTDQYSNAEDGTKHVELADPGT